MSLHHDILLGSKKYHEEIDKIIEPIKSFFGIITMVYIEVSCNNKLITLTNNYPWLEHCVNNKYYLYDPQMVSPNNIGSGHIMWSTNWETHYKDENYENSFFENSPMFGICNGLTWVNKDKKGYKAYIFSTNNENLNLHSKIYSNISLIKHFIHYFGEEVKHILKECFPNRVDLVELRGERYFSQRGVIEPRSSREIQKYLFLQQLNLLDNDLLDIKLTNREIQCISLYLSGNVAQDTADILSISRRTVETHMNNIKTKLKINYKKDLFKRIQILKELEII